MTSNCEYEAKAALLQENLMNILTLTTIAKVGDEKKKKARR